jgi:sec-independent protein translocase protein TatA
MFTGWERPSHWLVLAVVVLVLFGYKKLPDMSRSVGRSLRIFKTEMKGLNDDDSARDNTDAAAKPAAANPPNDGPTQAEQPAVAPSPTPQGAVPPAPVPPSAVPAAPAPDPTASPATPTPQATATPAHNGSETTQNSAPTGFSQ